MNNRGRKGLLDLSWLVVRILLSVAGALDPVGANVSAASGVDAEISATELTSAPSPSSTASVTGDKSPPGTETVALSWSASPDKARLVFDWDAPVDLEMEPLAQGVALTFSRPARMPSLEALPGKLSNWLSGAHLDGQRLVLTWTRALHSSVSSRDNQVVINLVYLNPSRSTAIPAIPDSLEAAADQDVSSPEEFWSLLERAYRRLDLLMHREDSLETLARAFDTGCDIAHPKLNRALALEQEAAGYRHDVGLKLRGGLTTGSGVGERDGTGDRSYLELTWDLLSNGYRENQQRATMLSRESELERIQIRGDLLDRSYRCRRLHLTRIFDSQRQELLRIKRDVLAPLYGSARRAYFKRRYQLDDLLEIEGDLEHTRAELEFLSDRSEDRTDSNLSWHNFNPPILDVDLSALRTAIERDDTRQLRARLQREILEHRRRARRDDDRLGVYLRANSDQAIPGTGEQTELVVGLRFTVPLGSRGDAALPYYLREIQERSNVDQWKQDSEVEAAYLELREQLHRTLRQRDRYERSLERLRRSITRRHQYPEEADLRSAVSQSRTLTEAAIELILAKEELFQRVNELLRKARLEFTPKYLRPVAHSKPRYRSRHGERSIYLWSSAFNDLQNTLLLDFLETKGIRHLLVSAGRRTDKEKLSLLLAEAGRRGIRISLVLGVNEWILPHRRADALEAVKQATALHDDIHLDVEPQAMASFKADRAGHLKQYLNLLGDTRLHLGPSIRLSVAVPVTWTESTYRDIATLVDELYLMAYGSSKPDTISRRIRPALESVEPNKLTLVLRISDFSDEWSLEQTIDALHRKTGLERYGIHQLSQFLTLARGIR